MLTQTLENFVNAFSLRYGAISWHATSLLKIFIVIEIVLFGIYFALEGGELLGSLLKKVLMIGAFQLLVTSFPWFVHVVKESFVSVGLASVNGSAGDSSQYLDPSWFLSTGFDAVGPLWNTLSIHDSLLNLGVGVIVYVLLTFILLFAYVVMAFQIFLTQLEFYILTTLAVILLPFGLFRPTSFLADKAIGAIFTISIKLMVLVFVASVAVPMLKEINVNRSETTTQVKSFYGVLLPSTESKEPMPLRQTFMTAMMVLAIALVFRKAPNIAADLVSSSSNLDVGPIVRPLRNFASAATQAVSSVKTAGATAVASYLGSSVANAAKTQASGVSQAASSSVSSHGSNSSPASSSSNTGKGAQPSLPTSVKDKK